MEKVENFTLRLEINTQVISVLSRNAEVWNKVSKFQNAVDQFNANQEKLVELQTSFNKDITAVEKIFNNSRKELEERTLSVVHILQVFAHDKKKKKLQSQLNHLNSDYLENCLDLELVKISKKIWLMANEFGGYAITFVNKIKAALNPDNLKAANKFETEFGLGPDMIKYLEESILSFIKAMLQYKSEMDQKGKVVVKMKKVNKKIKKLLTNKIDRLVLMFENENPGFYKEYHELREDHHYKHAKEIIDQETDFQDLLLDENELVEAKPKQKPKNHQKVNPETN